MEDIPADSIIFAIGQTSDLSFLDPADGVESERGLIKVNRETYQTTAPDVFACGDIAHGPRLFIDAIASRADRRPLHARLSARHAHRSGRAQAVVARRLHHGGGLERHRARESAGRSKANGAPPRSKSSKCDYAEAEARRQASRCLRCNVNTVFDTSKCVACNGCVDVCPENLIRLVGSAS